MNSFTAFIGNSTRGRSSLWLAATLVTCNPVLADWPAWRGPLHDGTVTDPTPLPDRWSEDRGVLWKTRLPGPGNSSPVLSNGKVWISQSLDEKGSSRALICFDALTGKELWRREVPGVPGETTHRTNPFCSGSPAIGEQLVVVSMASAGVHAWDWEGQHLWSTPLGIQNHIWGYGSSPVLTEDLVIINFGPGPESRLVALDRKTGKVRWEHKIPGGNDGNPPKDSNGRAYWTGTWADPLPVQLNGETVLLTGLPGKLSLMNPQTGGIFREVSGINPLVYASPILDRVQQIALVMGGFQGTTMAISTGPGAQDGFVWRHEKTPQRIGSAVNYQGHFFIVNENGTMDCLEARTGKLVWKERLKGSSANTKCWGSPILHQDKIYMTNQGGDTFIIEASPYYRKLGDNHLNDRFVSSMAAEKGRLYLRGYDFLWCLGQP